MNDQDQQSGAGEVKSAQAVDTSRGNHSICRQIEADLRAQLAQLKAPVGESIDTPEFRHLEADFVKATIDLSSKDHHADNAELFAARSALIAHIDAQLVRATQEGRAYQKKVDETIIARQHQDSKPTDLSKRLRKVYDDTLAFDSKLLIEAADEIERQAAQQKQGDAVRDSERWRFFIGTLAECEGEAEAKHITKMIDTARGLSEQGREAINAAVASAALRATNTGKEQK